MAKLDSRFIDIIATDVEASVGILDNKAITPKQLKDKKDSTSSAAIDLATTATAGIVRIATDTEAAMGENVIAVVKPSHILRFIWNKFAKWTQRTLPVSTDWRSVCWSPELGLFCAVATSSTIAATSLDGITWTQRTLPVSADWQSICWSPELRLFCAVAANSTIAITSPDGINWTQRTLPVSASWYSICWSPELRLFCTIASSSTIAATYGLN